MAKTLFISDEAYDSLTKKGMNQRFIEQASWNRREGIGHFIETLSKCDFEDTRPKDVKDSDNARLSSFHTPIWSLEHPRRQRLINISDYAIIRYCKIASDNLIVIHMYKGGPYHLRPNAITAATLEAIGIGWLTPTKWPYNNNTEKMRRRTTE